LPRAVPTKPRPQQLEHPAPAAAPANLYAGTSGWAYPTWKPGFYPATTRAKDFLSAYAARLNSVEVNYTFRSLCTPTQLAGWLAAVPENFRFSFKAPQRITHFQRLLNSEATLQEFLTSLAPVRKANKLGVLLFQLPPNFKADSARLETFLSLPCLREKTVPKLAFEFRNATWFTDDTFNILRAHNTALCIAESDDLQTPEVHTATTHRCYRLRCNGGYKPAQLKTFATKFLADTTQAETYTYFKHEDEPTGALNAVAMLAQANKLAGAKQ
jgi:uncharacterized protein YecE (DUF72 family)